MSSLPEFRSDGMLPEGNWECTTEEFTERFCRGQSRTIFHRSVLEIVAFGTTRGASRVIFGGSFISTKAQPSDLDCLLVFPRYANIPERTERLDVEGVKIDVLFCSEEDPELLGAFVHLFSRTRNDRAVGTVFINVARNGQSAVEQIGEPDERTLEIVRRAYIGRHFVDLNNTGKALVTIHGIKSFGEWNANVVQIASSNGWIVAPFFYGYQGIEALSSKKIQTEILDKLREHINQLSELYGAHVSILAHSFGTYLAARYITGFDILPYPIDTLILAGSVLDPALDFEVFRGKVASIRNEVAPNDKVVGWAELASLYRDGLIGNSGEVGFSTDSTRLIQGRCEIFDHNNVIRRDVIITRWMPQLEAYVGAGEREMIQFLTDDWKSKGKPDNAERPPL